MADLETLAREHNITVPDLQFLEQYVSDEGLEAAARAADHGIAASRSIGVLAAAFPREESV